MITKLKTDIQTSTLVYVENKDEKDNVQNHRIDRILHYKKNYSLFLKKITNFFRCCFPFLIIQYNIADNRDEIDWSADTAYCTLETN